MRISYYPPRNRWRVSYEVNRRQHRKFFATKTEAETFCANRREDVRQFGVPWATLTPLQRGEVQVQLDRLKRAGWSLRAAVDFTLEHGKAPPALPLQSLAAQCLRAKEAKGCRPRSLRKFRTTIDRFLIGRRDLPASDIAAADVHEFLTCNGWRAATARSFLIDLRTLFAWGVRNRLCRENPALAVELPRPEDAPPGILTPAQSAALMLRCQESEPTLLATLTLCLFAGVRPEEACRLAWENIGPDYVNVQGHKAKTRKRRLVTITPQLRAWLDTARAVESELPVANYPNKFNHVRRLAGLFKNWPHDAMRHSFASYHLAKHRNENHTAQEMGNSPQMIYGHYRELVRPADADAFFAILPGNAAPAAASIPADQTVAQVKALPQGKPGKAAPRVRRVTAEILGAIFQHGARTLTKPEAVAMLHDEYGFVPSTGFLALAATGRFRAHLKECNGKLSWTPFPLATAAEPPLPALPDMAAPVQVAA
jgi:integrase